MEVAGIDADVPAFPGEEREHEERCAYHGRAVADVEPPEGREKPRQRIVAGLIRAGPMLHAQQREHAGSEHESEDEERRYPEDREYAEVAYGPDAIDDEGGEPQHRREGGDKHRPAEMANGARGDLASVTSRLALLVVARHYVG